MPAKKVAASKGQAVAAPAIEASKGQAVAAPAIAKARRFSAKKSASGAKKVSALKTVNKQEKQHCGCDGCIYIPSLFELMRINDGFSSSHVKVSAVEGKGLGLLAQHDIDEGVEVAYYLTRLYRTEHLQPCPYLLGSGVPGYTCGLFSGSFPPPGADGVPFVAPFANEPTGVHGEPNCEIVEVEFASRWHRKSVLATTKLVTKGEEITWDYEEGYGRRSYPSKYN